MIDSAFVEKSIDIFYELSRLVEELTHEDSAYRYFGWSCGIRVWL